VQAYWARVPVVTILVWAWVLLNLTITVYIFGESPLAGTLTFLAALVMFPPLYALLARRFNIPIPSPLRGALAGILFAFAMSWLLPDDNRPNDTALPNDPTHSHVLLDVVGIGDEDTDTFTSRPQDWQLIYTFACWTFGRPGHFSLDIRKPDGSPTRLEGVSLRARSGTDSFVYKPGGSYSFRIRSNCRWRVVATG
jgi:hypothetical protein